MGRKHQESPENSNTRLKNQNGILKPLLSVLPNKSGAQPPHHGATGISTVATVLHKFCFELNFSRYYVLKGFLYRVPVEKSAYRVQ